MGFLNKLWKKIEGKDQIDLFFAPLTDSRPEDGKELSADECYIELYVDSLRLKKARRFATRFHGVVYSFVTLPREGTQKAEMAAISKPDKLANLDADSISEVIQVNRQMMGTVPWRGGPLLLEIGLFSVKAGNLLSPVIDFVTRVSQTAGIAFVETAKPFLPLITEGMDMIAGQKDDTNLEVGLDTSFNLTRSGTYAIIDAPKNSVDTSKLSLDPRDNKLLLDGRPLNEAYCVFSIRRAEQKSDYGEIPALKEKFEAIMAAIRAGKKEEAEAALTAFRLETIASPDLITSDAARLVRKARDKVEAAFGGRAMSLDARRTKETLADLDLYG